MGGNLKGSDDDQLLKRYEKFINYCRFVGRPRLMVRFIFYLEVTPFCFNVK